MVHAARLPARVPGFIEIMPFKAWRLDFNRIFGYATAIAVHAVLLLLLLVPITAPPAAVTPEPPRWIIPVKQIPPPEPKPIITKVVPRTPHPTPTHPNPTTQPPVDQQPVVDQSVVTNPVVQPPVVDRGDVVAKAGPVAGVQLEYAQAPAPAYPHDALRDAVEGTVMLRVLVDVDGHPLDVQVEHSSGNRSLDRAAREQVLQHWRFHPAMQNGRAVQAIGLVPVEFKLD